MIGTNNEAMRDPKQPGDRGVLMAFNEETGEFMWQATFEKLSSGRANDWPYQGIASSPAVVRGIAYFTSNRGQIIAADIKGFHDSENDGPYKDEKLTGKTDIDIIWIFDMMEEVGSFPHNLANCSPVIDGGLLYLQHRQRPGRKPRQHPVAEGAVDHRDRDRERQAGVGRQLGRRSHPARPVVDAGGRRHRRRAAGRARAGRRLGARLRGADRQEAVGVRHQSEGLGVAEDAQRSDQHAGDLRERRLHLERPGSRARRRRRPRLRDRRAPSAATSRRPA